MPLRNTAKHNHCFHLINLLTLSPLPLECDTYQIQNHPLLASTDMHNLEVIFWMLYECLKGGLNLVFITKKEFFKEVSLNGDLKDKEHLPMGRAGRKALQTKYSKGVGACKQKTRWQHAGRTVRSPQTPAAQGNHAGRLHIPSNSGEQSDG